MASDEVQPGTAQQPIEGELLNVLTTSNEQILNLISPTHLPDEENFDADSLLDAVEHERKKCIDNFLNKHFPVYMSKIIFFIRFSFFTISSSPKVGYYNSRALRFNTFISRYQNKYWMG
jgi:hypothetical protein